MHYVKTRYRKAMSDTQALRVEVPHGHAAVKLLGARSGEHILTKTGPLSEDGTRCRIHWEGAWVDATKTDDGWVFRLPFREAA